MPAMRPNWRSSGVATDEAMVSGLAPGSDAWTWIVGKSTWGRGDTGKKRYAIAPARPSATVNRVVAMGRLMNGSEIFMRVPPAVPPPTDGERACDAAVWPGDRRRDK